MRGLRVILATYLPLMPERRVSEVGSAGMLVRGRWRGLDCRPNPSQKMMDLQAVAVEHGMASPRRGVRPTKAGQSK